MIISIITVTIAMPKPIPALKIPPIALHELINKESSASVKKLKLLVFSMRLFYNYVCNIRE